MAYISYNKLWESQYENIVSKKDKVLDLMINQIELEVHDTYKKDEKITILEAVNDRDVTNKTYLDEKLFKKNGHL